MRRKKLTALLLGMALVTGMFGGCQKASEESEASELERGRYVQSEVELPEELTAQTAKQLFTAGGSVHILTAEQRGDATFLREWEQQEDGFTDVTKDWLASLEMPCETWVDMQLMQEESGTQYLYVRLVSDGYYVPHLWREEGGEALEITPEKWTVPNETWGGYENIQGIAVLDDGTLTAISYTSIDVIKGEDGSVLKSQEIMGGYGETVLSDGENIYATTYGNSGVEDGIEVRPKGSGDNTTQIAFPISSMGGGSLGISEEGTLVAAGAEGIYRYNRVSEEWEKLMEGSETDFALSTCWSIGLTMSEDGSVYSLFMQEGGLFRLMRYYYDPDAVSEIKETLRLYTVWENSLLQQAAVMYHRKHPEVLITVDYTYALGDRYSGKTPDYDQVFQSLNTMLMGDESPDILVMDHLDMNSYAEKGLLLNIDDIVAPMEQSGELFSSITGSYVQEDGGRYAVPLQFGFVMAVGRDIPAEDMESLEALAEFLEGKEDSYMGPLTAAELVDQFYPYFCGEIVENKELKRDTLGDILQNLKKVADNSGIVNAHADDERKYSVWNLPSKAKLAFVQCDGFFDTMFPISVMEYAGGDFTAYENSFVPTLQTGISTKSEHQETAKDFLRFALSEEIQDSEPYGAFPVNQAAFEKLAYADRSSMSAATSITAADGSEEMFEILPYSEDITKRIVELCRELDRPAVEDAKIREELIAALPGYLDGSRTLEETLDSIEGGLKMYLAE